ncbi:helix-turn-helix domain-containing protein [Moheibacter sediminis]|uniref:AraC-type DNA-binding protein n=1 Tax=Moheibacter sediminis TaxID=1434700 RepID=A0A1W2CG00_9FLAO|nr:helix-turn-helix domain-containing protein [Moheibacter sediminis]SMC84187.1 AraC-type DNA-binding protein [Moheibacter sediminis]
MENWKIFIDFVLIAGMSLLGLFVVFLIKSKINFSQKLLIIFFANAFFFLLYYYAFLHKISFLAGVAILFGHGMGFLLGPVLYYQLKSLVLPKSQIVKPLLLSLIPFFLLKLFISFPLSIAVAWNTFETFHNYYVEADIYINQTENLYFIIYLVMSLNFLKKFNKLFEESYSTIGQNNLNWYKYLIYGFIFIIIIDVLCTVYELFYPMIPWNIGTLVAFGLIGMFVYLGYKGMFQSKILMPEFLLEKLSDSSVSPHSSEIVEQQIDSSDFKSNKPTDSFSPEEVDELKMKLKELLEDQKLYRDESLNLTELADKMGISNKRLSELLNQYLNISFYNLINDYRIEEVKERIKSEEAEKYTLLSIAFDSGFQSKASFNRIFKQKTGFSPSEYRKRNESSKVLY